MSYRHGVIATPHYLATQSGEKILEKGGSAIDATIAASAVLSVVYPHMTGLGGDSWSLLRLSDGTTTALNGTGRYCASEDPEELSKQFNGKMPDQGGRSSPVPGAVAAWSKMHSIAGRLSWEQLFEDAIQLSREGAPVSSALGRDLETLWPQLTKDPGMSRVFGDGAGGPLKTGATLRQPNLSESLSRIAKKGASDFYEGDLARKLVLGMQTLGSRVSARDFEIQESQALEAISREFKGHVISTAPPNSQGFTLLQILGAMEIGGLDPNNGLNAGVVSGLFSLANQERDAFLGDPRVSRINLSKLLSVQRIEKLLDEARTNNSGHSQPKPRAGGDTVGVSAMDSSGLAISSLQSIFYAFGAKVLEAGTGIILSNRAASFSLEKSHPAYLTPGSRPPSTLLPVLIDHPDGALTSVSSMGGRSQAQIQSQLISNIVRGDSPQEAVTKPRFVVGSFGSALEETVVMEPGMPFTRGQLESQTAIPINESKSSDDRCGHAQIVQSRDGLLLVGTDPRADGAGDSDDY